MPPSKRNSNFVLSREIKLTRLSPDAKFVVWGRAAYRRDGFHCYEGPGERKVLGSFDNMEEANQAAKRLFISKNPWGVCKDDVLDDEPEARMKDGLLYLVVSPPDSEVWEVGVAEWEYFQEKLQKGYKPSNDDEYDDDVLSGESESEEEEDYGSPVQIEFSDCEIDDEEGGVSSEEDVVDLNSVVEVSSGDEYSDDDKEASHFLTIYRMNSSDESEDDAAYNTESEEEAS